MMKTVAICVPDKEYVFELEYILSQSFSSDVRLEFITEDVYMTEYIRHPHVIDVLFIDEAWSHQYSVPSAKRIIRVMEDTPQSPDEINKLDGVPAILKMFDASFLKQDPALLTSKTAIIDIFSTVGGAGKTATALGIADALSSMQNRVLYVNADYLQSFYEILAPGNTRYQSPESILLLSGNASDAADQINTLVGHQDGFDYVLPLDKSAPLYRLDESTFYSLCDAISDRNIYDFIVLEHPSVLTRNTLSRIEKSSQLLYVTKQDDSSLARFHNMLHSLGAIRGKCMLIEGRYQQDAFDAFNTESLQKDYPVCARIPAVDTHLLLEDIRNAGVFSDVAKLL